MLVETAAAKINLTLRVHGRRPDGYHELSSLVCFADVADRVTLSVGGATDVVTSGAFASAIDAENLVVRAIAAARRAEPRLQVGRVGLEKNLPVAAGLGGGSADAAAMLRLLMRANPALADGVDWHAIARSLGADVPVCLSSRAQWMAGIGERVIPMPALPPIHAVLANPREALATAAVFRALAAPPLAADFTPPAPPVVECLADLNSVLVAEPNDLEAPAVSWCPAVPRVLDALRALPGARLARMSGSGATCFALFATGTEAASAAATLSTAWPGWWVAPAKLQ